MGPDVGHAVYVVRLCEIRHHEHVGVGEGVVVDAQFHKILVAALVLTPAEAEGAVLVALQHPGVPHLLLAHGRAPCHSQRPVVVLHLVGHPAREALAGADELPDDGFRAAVQLVFDCEFLLFHSFSANDRFPSRPQPDVARASLESGGSAY